MIDLVNKRIYYDYTTRSTFGACKEKARLGIIHGYRPKQTKSSLAFGHAIHTGWQGYYDALTNGWHDTDGTWHFFTEEERKTSNLLWAQAAFLRDMQFTDVKIPVNIEAEERRSLERGLALLEAYVYRWRNEPYENILDSSGAPLTEVGFSYYLTTYEGFEIYYVGYIDRLMRSMQSGRPVIFEGKTTTQGLSVFIQQCKPNHQVTGYFKAAQELGFGATTECVWDCTFISDRKPDLQKALTNRFLMYGVDIDKDFARQTTMRSPIEIAEFFIELEEDALDYARWLLGGIDRRWPRNAPGSCHAFGGCQFREVCSMNAQAIQPMLDTFFRVEKWQPWKRIIGHAQD